MASSLMPSAETLLACPLRGPQLVHVELRAQETLVDSSRSLLRGGRRFDTRVFEGFALVTMLAGKWSTSLTVPPEASVLASC